MESGTINLCSLADIYLSHVDINRARISVIYLYNDGQFIIIIFFLLNHVLLRYHIGRLGNWQQVVRILLLGRQETLGEGTRALCLRAVAVNTRVLMEALATASLFVWFRRVTEVLTNT